MGSRDASQAILSKLGASGRTLQSISAGALRTLRYHVRLLVSLTIPRPVAPQQSLTLQALALLRLQALRPSQRTAQAPSRQPIVARWLLVLLVLLAALSATLQP